MPFNFEQHKSAIFKDILKTFRLHDRAFENVPITWAKKPHDSTLKILHEMAPGHD